MNSWGLPCILTLTIFTLVICRELGQTTTVYYTTNFKLVQEFRNSDGSLEDCSIYGDRETVEKILRETPAGNQHQVTRAVFDQKAEGCSTHHQSTGADGIKERVKRGTFGIYPGTHWCGKGNIAEDNSLGSRVEEDKCCRAHDQCLPKITVGQTKYGLTNEGSFTTFHCELCDRKFYDCLKEANTFHSNVIGVTFFDVIGVRCFEKDYPLVCSSWWIFKHSCERDTSKPKVYQFKDYPDAFVL